MNYRINCSPEYGILLWAEAPCGLKQPLMRWKNLEEVRVFGEKIMEFYNHEQQTLQETREQREGETSAIAEKLLLQAFGEEDDDPGQTG